MSDSRKEGKAYIAVAAGLISLLTFIGFFVHSSESEHRRLAEAELKAVANGIARLAAFELRSSPTPKLEQLLEQLAAAEGLSRIQYMDSLTAKIYEIDRKSRKFDDQQTAAKFVTITLDVPVIYAGKLQGQLELEKTVFPSSESRSIGAHLLISLLTLVAVAASALIGLKIFIVARVSSSQAAMRPLSPLHAIASPFRQQDSPDFAALRPDQVAAVVRQAGFTMLVNLANVSFLLGILWSEVPRLLLVAWSLIVYLLVLSALWSWWKNHKRPLPAAVSKRALRKMTVRTGLLGLAWGIALSVFFTDAGPVARYILIAVGLGTAAGGTAALAPIPSAAIAFSGAILVPGALRFATLEGEGFTTLAILCVLYACAMGAFLAQVYHAFARNVLARLEEARQSETLALVMNTYEEQASDWLWETDPEGRLRLAPKRMEMLFGTDPGGLNGRSFQELGDIVKSVGWRGLFQSFAKGESFRDKVVETIDKSGKKHWISLSGRCRANREWHGVGSDVTAREQALASMREATEAAESASRVTSAFLATTSHELRTPLNAIIGFSQMLTLDKLPPEKVSDYIETINQAGQHLLLIVNGILEMAQIEAGNKRLIREDFDLEAVVRESVEFLSLQALQAKVQIRCDPGEKPVILHADRQALRQVFLNIIGNAVKFTPAGGSVDIRLREVQGMVDIMVRDTGIGIASRHIDRVFQPFAQADDRLARRYEGTGLGLSIAKGLIELHGGNLSLTSKVGQGTTLTIKLPRHLYERA
ncbi:HAMP domain-containing sensor histidine kinase [Pelagibius sp. Alg239-R121]|uniref:PAS domain-containing sensor histidine kinase n=1 Tax=Pelagibius sp. Alg239-R121 TaxID=2993448 RepID=UPI0024A7693B|nr:HAMP domain-containing sensor histidine kinase [Pelagibius sp. Alg239-R121]